MNPILFAADLGLIGLFTLLLAVGVVRFLQVWGAGELRDSLAYIVYLNERRTRFAALFTLVLVGYVLTGVVSVIGTMDLLRTTFVVTLLAASFVTASVGLLLLLVWGFRPRRATVRERTVLDASESRLYALGLVDRSEFVAAAPLDRPERT